MRRRRTVFFLLAALVMSPTSVWAQNSSGTDKGSETLPQTDSDQGNAETPESGLGDDIPPAPPEPPPPTDDALTPQDTDLKVERSAPISRKEATKAGRALWKDIAVLARKPFLKRRRVELMPFVATTVNDNLIQHTAFGGELNYFLTDILAVGAQGMYFLSDVSENEFYVRRHLSRVASLNKYVWSATGNFSYVPIYGKFSVFNRPIFYYEVWVSGGIGVTGTEVIPRDFALEPFSNIALTFPIGIGARFFITDWMAVQVNFKNYMLIDTYEAPNRTTASAEDAKANGETDTTFVNNMMLTFGVSFFLPTSFEYKTFR